MTDPTQRFLATECPACGAAHQQTTQLVGVAAGPQPGQIALCAKCGAICRFDKDLAMVLIPEADLQDPRAAQALALRKKIRELRGLPV